MKNNDDLFDKDIRNRLKMENMKVPEKINKKIDDTINNLGKRKRNYKKASGICAACIAGTIIFGVTMPTYAQNIPILGKIFERFDSRIYENYDKKLSLEDMSDKFHISRSYLSKKFKAVTGFGFKEYIVNVRIKNACRLLLETNKSITDIAFECGFNDSNYFGDAFRHVKGVSPNKYRKNKEAI